MSQTGTKNSVSILYEFCQANKLACPIFKLAEDESYMLFFIMTCTVSDKTTKGIGRSKKQARVNAADKMLEKLIDEGINKILTVDTQVQEQNPIDMLCDGLLELKLHLNPVGYLQEYCMAQKLPLPEYTNVLMDANGYTIVCGINNLSTSVDYVCMLKPGRGRNKRIAKAGAAKNMCELLVKEFHGECKASGCTKDEKDEASALVNDSVRSVDQSVVKSEYMLTVHKTEEHESEPKELNVNEIMISVIEYEDEMVDGGVGNKNYEE